MLPSHIEKVLARNYKNIGTLPTIVGSLIRILNDPKSAAKDLAKVISTDKVLSLRLLKMVNSAYFGLRADVIDIKQAIGLVGYNVIRSFTFCITLFDSMLPTGAMAFSKEKLWTHSLGVGIIARRIATKMKLQNAEEYFVAGLVHDIGKVFAYQFLTFEFYQVLETIEKKKITFREAEMEVFKTYHSEIGAWIMDKWKLPEMLVDSVEYHHSYDECQKKKLVAPMVIMISDAITKELEIGFSGDNSLPEEYEILKSKFQIDQAWIDSTRESMQEELATFEEIFVKK